MKTLGLEDINLGAVGSTVHLTGTVWRDNESKQQYVVPLSDEYEPVFDNLAIVLLDSNETIKLVNQAWLLEAKRYPGFKGHATKVALVRMRKVVEPELMWQVYRRDNFKCVYCGVTSGPMTYDHFIPESQGGPTNVENGRTSCKPCNSQKADRDPAEWLESDDLRKRREWLIKRADRKRRRRDQ